ncbi:MAG: sigma-70 family RNA polymerase sigma factor [Planctomycetes bacterium]|nr:sigma-70 family RNA polymerase sigma factor [Planctomycetota bacterium]
MTNMELTTTGDGELLCDFIGQRRHEAFAEIVRRHGALVLGVCRSVLGNVPDAEDAAQAVFMALIQKAASLRGRTTLAGWLHRVAWYAAAHQKRSSAVRTRHEREAAKMRQEFAAQKEETIPPDVLHAGLSNMPDKYRLPIILHHLEGRSQEEVAHLLDSNVGAIAMRLNRGRQMLRDRLAKTGTTVSVAALATAMASQASAAVPAALVAATTKAAMSIMLGQAAYAAAVSSKIMALTKGALNMLFWAKMKTAAVLAAAAILVGGTATSTYLAVAAGPGGRPVRPPTTSAVPPKVETVAPASPSTPAAPSNSKVTVVEITDTVLVSDTCRFGVNLEDDSVFNGAVHVKKRVEENFEGTLYRQCHWGVSDENGLMGWFPLNLKEWEDMFLEEKAICTVLSGSGKQTTRKIKSISMKEMQDGNTRPSMQYFELDKPITKDPRPFGLLVENLDKVRNGQFRPLNDSDTTASNQLVIGDTPPGSFGCAALCLKSDSGPARVAFSTFSQRYGDNNGTWHVDLWAKIKEGTPKFTVNFGQGGGTAFLAGQPVALTNEWKKYQVTLKVAGVPEPKDANETTGRLMGKITLQSEGGQVLVDDIEAWMEGDENPTVFRDDCVKAIRQYNPGSLRFLQMGGSTVENTLMPPIKAYSFTSMKVKVDPYTRHWKNSFGLHQMYELCEYVGANPWYCLPGTLHLDEVTAFMEYLGGPVDSKYGKLRADMGHPKPWTDTFKQIHVEFGNEAWNNSPGFQLGGFNGPDYWKDLIDAGKKSPYYKSNVLFHAGAQASHVGRAQQICKDVPNADRLAIAPYIALEFTKADAETLNSDDKLFRWVFSWALQRTLKEGSTLDGVYKATKAAGKELSIYEVNHHTSAGDGPEGPRNTIVTSLAGGVNTANTMLLMLKQQGIRIQNFYALAQFSYNYSNQQGGKGVVRIWGSALNMRKGKERYRPTFLGCTLANKVLGGNLVETVHSGANPTFQGIGTAEDRKTKLDDFSASCIWSYAFNDGKKRGLILVNLDLKESLPVEVRFQGKPKGQMKCWTMATDNPAANNEFENEKPQVEIVESQVELQSGGKLTLPPCSMKALAWEVE